MTWLVHKHHLFESKTNCFGVEGIVFSTLKDGLFQTKTSCFGVVMVCDTFVKRVTLDNKLIVNDLASKVMLFLKNEHKDCMWKEKFHRLRTHPLKVIKKDPVAQTATGLNVILMSIAIIWETDRIQILWIMSIEITPELRSYAKLASIEYHY